MEDHNELYHGCRRIYQNVVAEFSETAKKCTVQASPNFPWLGMSMSSEYLGVFMYLLKGALTAAMSSKRLHNIYVIATLLAFAKVFRL
jgi:hypothetical protein